MAGDEFLRVEGGRFLQKIEYKKKCKTLLSEDSIRRELFSSFPLLSKGRRGASPLPPCSSVPA